MKEIKKISYNLAQLLFIMSHQKFKVLEWARGTGKSTIIGRHIVDCATQMPRAMGVIAAETYMQIKTRTLPSTILGLEQHGYYKDVHYFVGRKPPANWKWPEPYQPPLDYKHAIIFWNGFMLQFVSQDGGGASGRGLNIDCVIADEACRLRKEWLDTDVILTNRGNKQSIAHYPDGTWRYFEDCPLHHSVLLASSTPLTADGAWFVDLEKKAKEDPDNYFFLSAPAEVNRHNLGDNWFKQAKDTMIDFIYDAEVRNIRPKTIPNGFYPLLKESKHCYTAYDNDMLGEIENLERADCSYDLDLHLDLPLIFGVDWGNINSLVIAQDLTHELRFIKSMFVLSPKIIDDLVVEFDAYYCPKKAINNEIKMFYDPTGNLTVANSRLTYAQTMKAQLEKLGWSVSLLSRGVLNYPHDKKFLLWNEILKGTRADLPTFKMNKANCTELYISMSNAPAKKGSNEAIKKNKASESSKKIKPQHATHLSDAGDTILVGMFGHKIKKTEMIPANRFSK
jgi:hypothetical protein